MLYLYAPQPPLPFQVEKVHSGGKLGDLSTTIRIKNPKEKINYSSFLKLGKGYHTYSQDLLCFLVCTIIISLALIFRNTKLAHVGRQDRFFSSAKSYTRPFQVY